MIFDVGLAIHGVGLLLLLFQVGFVLYSRAQGRKFAAGVAELKRVTAQVEHDLKQIQWPR